MSLSRNLVDLYVLASGVSKVGSCIIASQTSAICLHVKTSSLLNPTPKSEAYAKPQQTSSQPEQQPQQPQPQQTQPQPQPQQQSQQPSEAAIEVPFPNFIEKSDINPVPIRNETAETTSTEKPSAAPVTPPVTSPVKPIETIMVEETVNTIKIETPTTESIVKESMKPETRREMKESSIPTSRFGRLWNYGTLATGMGMGAINESLKRATGLSQDTSGNALIKKKGGGMKKKNSNANFV